MILSIPPGPQKSFLKRRGLIGGNPPPESPDLNPIENLWHELKEYIRREVKPTRKAELIVGIKRFCNTVDVNKCNKYINHLQKVFPRIIQLDGAATGY